MAKNSLPASDQKTYLSLHNRFFDLPTITPKYKAFEVISDARLNAAQLMPGRMQPKAHFMDAVLTIGHTHNFFNLSFHYTIRVSSFEGYVQDSFTTATPSFFIPSSDYFFGWHNGHIQAMLSKCHLVESNILSK